MSEFAPHRARKRFGQNFLHDHGVINNILRAIAPRADQHLVEIGPGQGALTEGLLSGGGKLDVIELDHDLHPLLLASFASNPQFTLHKGDALKFDFRQLIQGDEKLRVVGNLPYNISTPLMFHLLRQADCIVDMHFMLQKEVVQRLAAGAGENHYGRLGIMVQYHCQVEHLFNVGPGAFSPAPKVDSAIVRLTPHAQLPHPADDVTRLEQVVREAFNQRRKTLRNTLKSLLDADAMIDEGIDPTLRPEQIDLAGFVRLANRLTREQGRINE